MRKQLTAADCANPSLAICPLLSVCLRFVDTMSAQLGAAKDQICGLGRSRVFNKRVLKWRSETHTVALKGKPWKATASKRSFSCKRKHVPKQEGYHPNTTQSSLQFYWWHAMGHKGVRLKGPVMHRCGSAQINVTNVYGPETPLTSALIGKYHIWGSWWLVQSRGHSGKCAKIGRPPSSTAEREIDQST